MVSSQPSGILLRFLASLGLMDRPMALRAPFARLGRPTQIDTFYSHYRMLAAAGAIDYQDHVVKEVRWLKQPASRSTVEHEYLLAVVQTPAIYQQPEPEDQLFILLERNPSPKILNLSRRSASSDLSFDAFDTLQVVSREYSKDDKQVYGIDFAVNNRQDVTPAFLLCDLFTTVIEVHNFLNKYDFLKSNCFNFSAVIMHIAATVTKRFLQPFNIQGQPQTSDVGYSHGFLVTESPSVKMVEELVRCFTERQKRLHHILQMGRNPERRHEAITLASDEDVQETKESEERQVAIWEDEEENRDEEGEEDLEWKEGKERKEDNEDDDLDDDLD